MGDLTGSCLRGSWPGTLITPKSGLGFQLGILYYKKEIVVSLCRCGQTTNQTLWCKLEEFILMKYLLDQEKRGKGLAV